MPALCFGQLKGTITEYQQADFFGGKLDYVVYRAPVKTDHWMAFFPGTGEMGSGDGLTIYKVYKHSFPFYIKQGIDYNFNIIIVQPSAYWATRGKILPWIYEEFKPSKLIVVGLSLGGNELWDYLMQGDRYKKITAGVSLSGRPGGGASVVPKMVTIPMYIYHGSKDTQVPYTAAIKAFDAYSALHPGLVTMDIQPVVHIGWTEVSSYGGALHKWIVQQFGPEEPDNEYSKGYLDGLNKAKVSIDSLINVNLK